ncbi:hypothetical protein GA0115254_109517 [Streptomyces sp. Ncost-T10-10d]|nr:hypothetical protein GA0115254_109517 [Streptomyces sp. Ncost-T10-10d]
MADTVWVDSCAAGRLWVDTVGESEMKRDLWSSHIVR